MAPAIAFASGVSTSDSAVDLLVVTDTICKLIGGLALVAAVVLGVVTQSMASMLYVFPALMIANTGEFLSLMLGIDLPAEAAEAPPIGPTLMEWVAVNYWIVLLVLLGVAAAIWLAEILLGVQLRRMHQPAVTYWKVRLLDALSEGDRFIEDEALRLALAGVKPDTDPIIARQILREMTQVVALADLYDYGGPTSLRGPRCIHSQLRELMREERCGGFVKRALVPMCAVLESMPRALDDALQLAAQERSYDDLLRLKLQSVAA